ncbi:MAG: nucleotidyltransferase domain-containing protein [Microcystaceae cyanobacterium]
MSQFGLKQDTINQINQIFSTYPEISKAILYGSRAKGNYKPGSDIDLTLIGDKINYHQLLELLNKIDDLLLPYFFDLSIFDSLDNPNLIDHIERVGITFYERETL